jgi:metallo-beta-lactamase family protein
MFTSVQFLGACGMVTGSSYLLTGAKGTKLLVDLGMFQEGDELASRNYSGLSFAASELSGVLLTHAHLDHCGRLPLVVQNGYTGKLFMTKATRQLTALSLFDAAKVAAEDTKKILYVDEDIEKLLTQVEDVIYDQSFSVGEFRVTFRDAGHILGSASIEVSDESGKTIVFSGDLGNTPEDMIQPTEPVKRADFVVMESTYGDRIHVQEDPAKVLMEEIGAIEQTGGALLIPAFSIERAQELIHRINHLKRDKKIEEKTAVFLDSPMAIRAMRIFEENPQLYNKELHSDFVSENPFDFAGLTLTEHVEDSKAILLSPGPKVIISGSGMMSGGRILHHAINYLADEKTRLLIVGYQAEGTLGRKILDGAKHVRIYDQDVAVNATVRNVESMSCHADQKKLLAWLGQIDGVEKVFLTHGENGAREVLRGKISERLGKGVAVVLPAMDEVFTF